MIAPTAQIIARQSKADQSRLPDEDAKSLVFDDTLLFDVDKFSGYDRFETGTRLNVGAQYTFQANNGIYARAVLGQSIQLAGANPYADPGLDPTVKYNYSPVSGLETDRSDYVAGLYLSPVDRPERNRPGTLRRKGLEPTPAGYGAAGQLWSDLRLGGLHVRPLRSAVTTLLGDQQDILGTLGLKLTNHWAVAGTMRYDIDAKDRIQDQLSLKYADECFVLTASYTETFVENAALDLKPDRTLMLRFELKHLGAYSYKTDQLNHVFGDTNQGPKL